MKESPIFKTCIFLILGILCAYFSSIEYTEIALVAILFTYVIVWLFFISKKLFAYSSLWMYLLPFLVGFFLISSSQGEIVKLLPMGSSNKSIVVKGEVVSLPKQNNGKTSFEFQVENVYFKDVGKIQIKEKVIVYAKGESNHPGLGDELFFKTSYFKIKNRGNPGEFDYEGFMKKKNVTYSFFTDLDEIQILDNHLNSFKKVALHFRFFLLQKIDTYLSSESAPVAKAILLGYKNDLNQETRSHYASSGASHILAVSGMHVGIIVLILNFVNRIWARGEKSKRWGRVLSILVIWFYVFMTGFSPSILRAGLMFSLFILAKLLDREYHPLNIIAVSAMILLLVNPFFLFDLGFQLSYCAILGIFFVYPRWKNKFYVKNKVMNWIWQLSLVSVSAQLVTLPLTLFYFHQFPSLFLVTNIVSTFFATAILIVGVLFFVFSWSDFILALLGRVLDFLVVKMDWVINFISTRSYATVTGIELSYIQVLVLIVSISVLFFVSFKQKKFNVWRISFCFLILVLVFAASRQKSPGNEFVVLNSSKQTSLVFLLNQQSYFLSNSADEKDLIVESSLNEYKNANALNLKEAESRFIDYSHDVIHVADKRIVLLSKENVGLLSNMKFDYIIYDGRVNPKKISDYHGVWVFTGKLSSKRKSQVKTSLIKNQIKFHDTQTQGALIQSF